jgi:hypothetical protein
MICALIAVFGCESPKGPKQPLSQEVQQPATKTAGKPTAQKAELQSKLEESQIENERLRRQVEALTQLPGDKRVDALYNLKAMKIGRYTNLYDEDKNGTKEKLVIYVQPEDEVGDVVKAAGAVEVQLWDLNRNESEAILGQWRIEPEELKKLWLASMLSSGYRLRFDVAEAVEKTERHLTVKVNFTDYLSGRTFTEQKAIKP